LILLYPDVNIDVRVFNPEGGLAKLSHSRLPISANGSSIGDRSLHILFDAPSSSDAYDILE
jgi:hypothetical protein